MLPGFSCPDQIVSNRPPGITSRWWLICILQHHPTCALLLASEYEYSLLILINFSGWPGRYSLRNVILSIYGLVQGRRHVTNHDRLNIPCNLNYCSRGRMSPDKKNLRCVFNLINKNRKNLKFNALTNSQWKNIKLKSLSDYVIRNGFNWRLTRETQNLTATHQNNLPFRFLPPLIPLLPPFHFCLWRI